MKKVLGLDIGTNSVGWAFIETNAYENPETLDGRILQLGSRIIPMDADAMSKFESGNPESKAAGRRQARGVRRLNQRYKLRRTRLIEALKILDWIPQEFPTDFKKLTKHSINKFLPFSDPLKEEAATYFGINGRKTTQGADYEIPEDWLIYFLKVKALKSRITLPELARVVYHYNQRRGFKSSRKDAKESTEETAVKYPIYEKWIEIVHVTAIENKGAGDGKDRDYTFYEITCKTETLEFKAIKKRKNPLDWLNKDVEVTITRKTNKDLSTHYSIAEVDTSAWENRKAALERDIDQKDLFISQYFLEKIRADREYRIKQRIVDRKFYQEEFKQIWEQQTQFYQDEFTDSRKMAKIADQFYHHNEAKNKELKGKDLFHILFNDIIYYQRGLKSQKHLLANCQYESKTFIKPDGTEQKVGVKVTSRSSPLFQEFRIWQTIHNLRLLKKEELQNGKLKMNIDVTDQFITEQAKEQLFSLFDSSLEVSHDAILKVFGFKKDSIENGGKAFAYKLNYPDDKGFPGNETKALFKRIFKKHHFEEEGQKYLDDSTLFQHLWHIVYSLPEEKDIVNALKNEKYFKFPEALIADISRLPEFKPQYASLSFKAINKLLPLMRVGKYWASDFSEQTKERINKLIDGEFDTEITEKLRQEFQMCNIQSLDEVRGLPTHLAAYIIYGRHSERADEAKYITPEDVKIKEILPYNSLRNPVVEKVIRETLSLVKDIWKNEKLGRPDFIHVELGREMKKNNKEREELTSANFKNRIEKERVIALLTELQFENFRENSLSDLEKFRIWKDNGGKDGTEKFEELFKSNKAEFVRDADVEKYRRWAEQNYRSPYSGKAIPLSELFTAKYQVDHIIPRSRFYDDSSANKVVVESSLNDIKGNRLAIQFIEDSQGLNIGVQSLADYLAFVDDVFDNKKKKRLLKLYEVPEDFIERQMNDTKYISRTVAQFLLPIAMGTETDQGVIYTSGQITADLKGKWGLHKLWKEILKPRFERLEQILGEQLIFPSETHEGDYRFGKDFKRIDHRHHALDALIVACTSRGHIKYLNSLNSLSNDKKDNKYQDWEKWRYLLNKRKQMDNKAVGMTEFEMPWNHFYADAMEALQSLVVSHKPTSKLVSKAINKYYKWQEVEPGKWEKKIHQQEAPKDDDKYWVAVRQSLFAQPLGRINLPEYKKNVDLKAAIKAQIQFREPGSKGWRSEQWRIAKSFLRKQADEVILRFEGKEKEILKHLQAHPLADEDGAVVEKLDLLQFKQYASKRVSIDESFTKDKIDKMPFAQLEKNWLTNLLRDHLAEYGDDPKQAFKGEALEMLHRKAPHQINKVKRKESGEKIDKNNKLLEGDKGVNQYFVVEICKTIDKKTGEEKMLRKYTTPPFLDCVERLAKGLPVHDDSPGSTYIVLSPGDLVYVPRPEEAIGQINWEDKKGIAENVYIMKSSVETKCYFLKANVASLINYYDARTKKGEFESSNKSEKTFAGDQSIKANFVKLAVDRLGNIKPA